MQPSDVTMYGRDYSAREFTDADFLRYMRENPNERPVDFLGRYIGYPTNPKCISAYPGMYQHHLNAGRPSFLFHQIGYTDMEGGYERGRAHGFTALNDARSPAVGWDGESHIVACMDRFYIKQGYRTLTAADLREYMRGFRSVLGDRTGFYGFYDSMAAAVQEGWAEFFVQCGARSAHVSGIHAWQENNYQPRIFGTPTDILELYCDPEFAFGGDMSYSHDRDYDEMAKTLTRWNIFSSRPKGGQPSHEDGPTMPEQLATIQAKLDLVINELSDDEAKIIAELRQLGGSLPPERQAELIMSRVDQAVWLAIQRLAAAGRPEVDNNSVPPQD